VYSLSLVVTKLKVHQYLPAKVLYKRSLNLLSDKSDGPVSIAAKNEEYLSFEYLKRLDERCSRLSSRESEFMLSFWSEALQCFQIYPNMSSERVSITTTWYYHIQF